MKHAPRTELEQDLIRSAERITADMLVRTPEANIALIITVAQTYAKRLKEVETKEDEADEQRS